MPGNEGVRYCASSYRESKRGVILALLNQGLFVVVQWLSHVQLFATPCPSLFPTVCANSCPLSQWCYPTISSSAIISSHPLPLPSPFAFSLSQHQGLFQWVSSLHQVSFSFSISPSNEYSGLISFWLTGLILQFRELWRVFSSTTIQTHQFFGTQPSLWFNSHIHTWLTRLQGKP